MNSGSSATYSAVKEITSDEDITSEIRSSFNSAAGTSYDQDTMEDAFYNGNLLIKQENKPVLASLTFKSDSGKLADDEDWEGANEITSKVYAQGRRKTGSNNVITAITTILKAIHEKQQISFLYVDYDVNKKLVFRNDGKKYTVSPYALILDNNLYYVPAYNPAR